MNFKLKKFSEFLNEESDLEIMIKNARKWDKESFVEEFIGFMDIIIQKDGKIVHHVNAGDNVEMMKVIKDKNGKTVYKNGIFTLEFYKMVKVTKDYSDIWQFILDNTKEEQKKAGIVWRENKDNKKAKIKGKTIKAYHFSPEKFKVFQYGHNKTTGQHGSEVGFFFFVDTKIKKALIKEFENMWSNVYLYDVKVKVEKLATINGEDVGTGWGRFGDLMEYEGEGYDSVLIKFAETGYAITDELVVFDDDNIKILKVTKIS